MKHELVQSLILLVNVFTREAVRI